MKSVKTITIPKWICRLYIKYLRLVYLGVLQSSPLGLPDGDVGNVVYRSKRSSLTYIYLVHPTIKKLNTILMWYLKLRTGLDFSGSINDRCAPINVYKPGDYIKPHRDRDMVNGGSIQYIAVLTLQHGSGGEFLYNFDHRMNVSADGKQTGYRTIYNNFVNIKQGQILILRNYDSIHGTLPLIGGERISLTFRSKP